MIDQYKVRPNEILLAACGSKEEAEPSIHRNVSYFTKYLIENISKKNDATYEELITTVTQQLKTLGIRTQNPLIEGDINLRKSKIFSNTQNSKAMANKEIITTNKWKVEKKDVQQRLNLNTQVQLSGILRVKTINPYFAPVKAYLLTVNDSSSHTGEEKQGILFVYNDLGRPNRGNTFKYDIVLDLDETTAWKSKQHFVQVFLYNENDQNTIDNKLPFFEMVLSHDKYQKFSYSRLDTILQNCDDYNMTRDEYFKFIAFLEKEYPEKMLVYDDPEEADPFIGKTIPDQTGGGVVIPLNFIIP